MQKMNKCTVLIAAWEMQCCGTPFKIGDIVEWCVEKDESGKLDFVDVDNIDFDYVGHYTENDIQELQGKIVSIAAIHYAYRSSSKSLIPIAGIAVDVKEADGWDESPKEWDVKIEEKHLSYYLVHLENVNLSHSMPFMEWEEQFEEQDLLND